MKKSRFAIAVDGIQAEHRPFFKANGFRVRGRTFNRVSEDGLTEVVNFQMGSYDPPGTTEFSGLTDNLYGKFAVNLGIYVPEVAKYHGEEAKSWVQEFYCCVRARPGELCADEKGQEIWWHARHDEAVVSDVRRCLESFGMPFLARFSTRDRILSEWCHRTGNMGASSPPRIVMAIILAKRGQTQRARELLTKQMVESWHPGHSEYVRKLMTQLDLEPLDG